MFSEPFARDILQPVKSNPTEYMRRRPQLARLHPLMADLRLEAHLETAKQLKSRRLPHQGWLPVCRHGGL